MFEKIYKNKNPSFNYSVKTKNKFYKIAKVALLVFVFPITLLLFTAGFKKDIVRWVKRDSLQMQRLSDNNDTHQNVYNSLMLKFHADKKMDPALDPSPYANVMLIDRHANFFSCVTKCLQAPYLTDDEKQTIYRVTMYVCGVLDKCPKELKPSTDSMYEILRRVLDNKKSVKEYSNAALEYFLKFNFEKNNKYEFFYSKFFKNYLRNDVDSAINRYLEKCTKEQKEEFVLGKKKSEFYFQYEENEYFDFIKKLAEEVDGSSFSEKPALDQCDFLYEKYLGKEVDLAVFNNAIVQVRIAMRTHR